MGFWSKLSDALPHKSMARGRELAACGIREVTQISNPTIANSPETYQCKICTIMPRAKESGDIVNAIGESIQIYKISLVQNSSVSFHDSPDIEVCNVCLKVFLSNSI